MLHLVRYLGRALLGKSPLRLVRSAAIAGLLFAHLGVQAAAADPEPPSFGSITNYSFDIPGHPLTAGPENAGFDTPGYLTPAQPSNSDFETGNLAGWALSGTGGVRSDPGGYNGTYYAYLGGASSLTSSAFLVPSDAQTLRFSVYANERILVSLLDDLGGSPPPTLFSQNFWPNSSWHDYSINVSAYRGRTIRVRFDSDFANDLRVDAVLLSTDIPGWQTSANYPLVVNQGGPYGPYAKLLNGGTLTSSAFLVPSDAQTLRFSVYANERILVSLLDDLGGSPPPTLFSQNFWPNSTWQSYSINVSAYRGRTLRVRFDSDFANDLRVDAVLLSMDIPGWQTSANYPLVVNQGGPYGPYAKLLNGGTLTSSAFLVPSEAQTLRFSVYANERILVSLLDDLGGSPPPTLFSQNFWPSSSWQSYSINVSAYRGRTLRVRFDSDFANDLRVDSLELDSFGSLLGSSPNIAQDGEPVNMTTGNYLYNHQDLAIPGRGLGLTLSRSFNSLDSSTGPFGNRWRFNYGMALAFNTDSSVALTYPDGRRVTYARNQDGSYARPVGVYDSLTRNGDGSYVLTTKTQARFDFASDGKLISIADRNGNTLTLSYLAGRLHSVADPSGRTLTLSYGAAENSLVAVTPTAILAFPNADFEQGNYNNWTLTGTAFGSVPTSSGDGGKQGTYYASSYRGTGTDTATGTLTSVPFTAGKQLLFRVNGGTDVANLKVSLLLTDDSEVRSYTNSSATMDLRSVAWDTTTWEGQQVRVRVTDNATGGWGQQGIDEIRVVYSASGTMPVPLGEGVLPFSNSNFEDGSYLNWFATGTAFGVRPVTNNDPGREGTYYPNGYDPTVSDTATGTLTSTPFTAGRSISLLINGGNKPNTAYVALVLPDGTEVLKTTHTSNSRTLDPVTWSTSPYEGQSVRIRLVDGDTSSWGWVGVDNVRIFYGGALVQQITDPAGRVYGYSYDASGNLTTYTDPMGGTLSYEYGPYGMTRATDQNDHVFVDNRYDALGRVVEQLDPMGNRTSFSYDVANRTTSYTDQLGHSKVYTFDGSGRTVAAQDELLHTESYSYDATGNRVGVTPNP